MQLTDSSTRLFTNDLASSTLFTVVENPAIPVQQPSNARKLIIDQIGEQGYRFITGQLKIEDDVFLTSTSSPFNSDLRNNVRYSHIVNLKNLNHAPYLNRFFHSANEKLPLGGLYINCVETFDIRKKRILKMLPRPLNWMHYMIDMMVTRIFPKLLLTKGLYFFFTRGKVCGLSRAEVLGRLSYCGFEIVTEKYLDNRLFFVARKIKNNNSGMERHYGPIIRLKRIGKGGKIFDVYKLRTMHAYSEYLQQYVFEKNQLQTGGKFQNDFRISPEGKFFRKFWLDELPMFINFLKGDMKLVGVRPLSQHYFNLYSPELRAKRVMCKPGLIPPFYADMPKTLDEIMSSEMKYLEAYLNSPFKTDVAYFFKAFNNIFFKGARSK